MKVKFILVVLLFSGFVSFAQQETQFTQYMYNTSIINPGYAGSRGVLSVLALHRTQWVGLEGAPVSNTLTMHTPLGNNSRLGLGLSIINDKLGPSTENTVSADVSYTIPTSDRFKLAFGIKGTFNMLSVDFNKTTIRSLSDGLIRSNIDNKSFPNIGAGLYWYSDKTYLGLSVPYLLEQKYYDNDVQYIAGERSHIHGIVGHVFDLNSSIKFKPSALVKAVKGAPLQVDLSANFLLQEKLTLGLAYRWSAAVSAMAGFQISDSWLIGYAYDKDTTRLGNFNSGSHEIFLRYELFKSYDKVVSPRFF